LREVPTTTRCARACTGGIVVGLRIVDGEVIVDHAENDHLNTGTEGNPIELSFRGMTVHSVFGRRRISAKMARNRTAKLQGDNCPLIYALKGLDELTVLRTSVKRLNDSIPVILDVIEAKVLHQIDVIVPMPSSSGLALILARRLWRRMASQNGTQLRTDIIVKSTNLQASARAKGLTAPNNKALAYKEANELKAIIRTLHATSAAPYAAKEVKTRFRKYFDPLQLAQGIAPVAAGTRFLLVDDLMATGETLVAAIGLLTAGGTCTVDHAVTWFSPLGEPT